MGEHRVKRRTGHVRLDEFRKIANERHLAVIEIAQREAAKIKIPSIRILVGAIAQGEHLALGLNGFFRGLRTGGGQRIDDVRETRLRRGTGDIAQRHGRGANLVQKQLQAKGTEIFAVVGIVRFYQRARFAGLQFLAATVLIHPLAGLFMDQINLDAIHLVQRHAGFAGVNLRLERVEKLVQRGFLEIDELGEIEIIKFLEMMPQGGVHLGLGGDGIEHVIIAHAFFLGEFHREQEQRGMDAFVFILLEIVPAEETQDEAQLGEAIFRAVVAGFTDDFIQHAGNVGRIFEAEIFAERHGPTGGNGGGEFGMPQEKLLQLDVPVIQQDRHGGDREIQGVERGLEINQPVTA